MAITALLFTIAFIAGCLLAVVRHPIYGLMTYVAFFYVNPPTRWWGQGMLLDVRWSLIAGIFSLIGVFIHIRNRSAHPFFRQPVIVGFSMFLVWIAIQLAWAINVDKQLELLQYYAKFLIAAYLIYRSVDTERHLRWFLWSHCLGCFYFGWLVYTTYSGGRFDDFGGAGIKDANEAALTMGTATLAVGSLFLIEGLRNRIVAVGITPFLLNGMIATISRSAFLALIVGGTIYNWLSPARLRKWVVPLSVLGLLLIVMLTDDSYWTRMDSITQGGVKVEGVDTGADRIAQWKGQLRIFKDHPAGCGHQCTTELSASYFEKWVLSSTLGVRASHNTFLSMLVDHGFVGGIFYLSLLAWVLRTSRRLRLQFKANPHVIDIFLPAIIGGLMAMFVADMFVPYIRYEVRFWYVSVLLVMGRMAASSPVPESASNTAR